MSDPRCTRCGEPVPPSAYRATVDAACREWRHGDDIGCQIALLRHIRDLLTPPSVPSMTREDFAAVRHATAQATVRTVNVQEGDKIVARPATYTGDPSE